MSYRIRVPRGVGKQIGSLQVQDRNRVDAAILALENEPRPPGVEKLAGRAGVWRVRVGDYRIVFTVDDTLRIVEILRVAHRREVYRR